MQEPDGKAKPPRPATSEAIPRAVESLIQLVVRWICFGLAAAFGLLSVAAWSNHWPSWVAIPLSVITFLAAACGAANRPRGRLHFDRVGPSIIVPDPRPQDHERPDGPLSGG